MRALLLRLRHRVEYGLVLVARWLDRILGPRLSGGLAAAVGRLAYRVLRIRAEVTEDQLRRAFPDRDEAWIRRVAGESYAHLGREAMTLIRLSRLGREAVIAATDVDEGFEALASAVAEGRGAVVVTGHLGNWEIGGSGVAARRVPVDAVARPQKNPLVDRLINDARARLGMTVIPLGGATKRALRSLRAGRVVALVADQDARRRGLFVPFFGRPASSHRGPALLALRSGAPVFAAVALRQPDGRYEIRLRHVPVPAHDDPEAQERELTAALAAALEAWVREAPGQYLWQHRRWKTRPLAGRDGAEGNGNGPD